VTPAMSRPPGDQPSSMPDNGELGAAKEPISELQHVSEERILDLLLHGELALQGLVPWSSNYTFLVMVEDAEMQSLAVYKPARGEQRLWDFPAGTLCRREVAAYLLSRVLGWPAIPPVLLREGPEGLGSVQFLVHTDWEEHFFTLREDPAHDTALRQMAVFDYVVNNADRKGGHVIKGQDGRLWAIDHGLTFHVDYKLRTVIWDYAGETIPATWMGDLRRLRQALAADSTIVDPLLELIERNELVALRQRLATVLRRGVFPRPRRDWRNVPYPLV
jgi:uncharacterized repeat protein (TIGR03843 family)